MIKWECNVNPAFIFSIFRSKEDSEVNNAECFAKQSHRLNGFYVQIIKIKCFLIKSKITMLMYRYRIVLKCYTFDLIGKLETEALCVSCMLSHCLAFLRLFI